MGKREQDILSGIRARAARGSKGPVRVGIGDDAAVLRVGRDEELAVTTDFSLEDVHFRRAWHPPEAVGHKCLARGLSDIAAMGARPIAAFLSLAVPRELTRGRRSWVDRFYGGLLALAGQMGVPLAGGDLAEAPGARVAADIVVVGAVERGRALLRSGAKAGDLLYVTGALGGAAAELRALTHSPPRFRHVTGSTAEHPHLFPQPRIAVGRALVRRCLASAGIDVSDGLSVDLLHLCEESKLRAEVDAALLPRPSAASLADALHGGDDYELLFTADSSARIPNRIAGVPVRRIGRMLPRRAGEARMMVLEEGVRRVLKAKGWQHF